MEKMLPNKKNTLNNKIIQLIGDGNQFAIKDKQIMELQEKLKKTESNILRLQNLSSLDEEVKGSYIYTQEENRDKEPNEFPMPPLPAALQDKYAHLFSKTENEKPDNTKKEVAEIKLERISRPPNLFWEDGEKERPNQPKLPLPRSLQKKTCHVISKKENKTPTLKNATIEDYTVKSDSPTPNVADGRRDDARAERSAAGGSPPPSLAPSPLERCVSPRRAASPGKVPVVPSPRATALTTISRKPLLNDLGDFILPPPPMPGFSEICLEGSLASGIPGSSIDDPIGQPLPSEPSNAPKNDQASAQSNDFPPVEPDGDDLDAMAAKMKEVKISRGFKNILRGVKIQDKIASTSLSACVRDLQEMQDKMQCIRNVNICTVLEGGNSTTRSNPLNITGQPPFASKETINRTNINPWFNREAAWKNTILNSRRTSWNKKLNIKSRDVTAAMSFKKAQRFQDTMQKAKMDLVNMYGKSRLEPDFMSKYAEPPRWKL